MIDRTFHTLPSARVEVPTISRRELLIDFATVVAAFATGWLACVAVLW